MTAPKPRPTTFSEFPLPCAIQMPQGWIEQTWSSDDRPPTIGREFRTKNEPGAVLCVWYRGRNVHAASAAALQKLFAMPPHALAAEETETVRPALGNMGDPKFFTISGARTEKLSGRNVLFVAGKWIESGNSCLDAFVPLSDDCKGLQEIYFTAPSDAFERNIRPITTAICGVQWL